MFRVFEYIMFILFSIFDRYLKMILEMIIFSALNMSKHTKITIFIPIPIFIFIFIDSNLYQQL